MKTIQLISVIYLLCQLSACSIPQSPAVVAHAQQTSMMKMSGAQTQISNNFWK